MFASTDISMMGAFAAGVLSFLSPCVLPLVPSFITYLTGLTFADIQAEHPPHVVRRKTVTHALLFILGFTLVFVLMGASATFAGSFIRENVWLMRKIGGGLIMIFGLHIIGILPINLLLGEKRVTLHHKPAGYAGSILVGIAFASGWTPCIGPILASILMIAAAEQTVYRGILLLLAYSLGLALPFFLASLAMHRFLAIFNKFRKHIRLVEIVSGIFLFIAGAMIFFDKLSMLQRYISF